jgi:hypothetical protein
MSSSLDKAQELEDEKEREAQVKELKQLAQSVEMVRPQTTDYYDLRWFFKNKDKIIRNRRLIEMLG